MAKEVPREMPTYTRMPCGDLCHLLKVGNIGRKVVQRPSVHPPLPKLLSILFCSKCLCRYFMVGF